MFALRYGWHEEQRTALKEFIISYSSHRFLPWENKDMTTAKQKHDQIQFSSQSPDSKHNHIHNSTICLVFLYLLPSFPSDTPYLAYPKVSY